VKMFVGLGNPGAKYNNTRHNVGFMAIDYFLKQHNLSLDQRKFNALYTKVFLDGESLLIVQPQTFMNLSGEAVRDLANYFKIESTDIYVIHDDMDLELAQLRLRPQGGSGGQKGMANIIDQLGTNKIKRFRIGIGKRGEIAAVDYVLGKFSSDDLKRLEPIFNRISEALDYSLKTDFDKVMSKYNNEVVI